MESLHQLINVRRKTKWKNEQEFLRPAKTADKQFRYYMMKSSECRAMQVENFTDPAFRTNQGRVTIALRKSETQRQSHCPTNGKKSRITVQFARAFSWSPKLIASTWSDTFTAMMEKRKQFDPECLQKVDEVIFFAAPITSGTTTSRCRRKWFFSMFPC